MSRDGLDSFMSLRDVFKNIATTRFSKIIRTTEKIKLKIRTSVGNYYHKNMMWKRVD